MQSKKWCKCNIFITANNQFRLYIFWHNDTLIFLIPLLIDDYKLSPKYFPWINPMEVGAPWDDAYLEPQQKEQSYVMFINKSPTIYQNTFRD